MNYNDYRTYLLACEYLGKAPTGKYKKICDYLTEMWEGMVIVADSQNDWIVFRKGDGWFFIQDSEYGDLWCHQDRVWSCFRTDMGMKDTEIQDFIKSTVEERLKCKVGTPRRCYSPFPSWVEERLKCKVGTPIVRPSCKG